MEFKETYFKVANTIQQDFFMLTKAGHYKTHNIPRIDAAKLILSVHVVGMEYLQLKDIIFWLMKEFYVPGIILPKREDATVLLVNPGSIHQYGSVKPSFQELVIHELLDRIATLQVFRDGQWLMPFDRPIPDTNVQLLFDAYQKWLDESESPPNLDQS